MLRLFKNTPQINFFRFSKVYMSISLIVTIAGIVAISLQGLNLGIDFRGGSLVQIKFQETQQPEEVELLLLPFLPKISSVTYFGGVSENELLVSLSQDKKEGEASEENISEIIAEAFQGSIENYEIRRIEKVGPKVGAELYNKAINSIIFALLGILVYITIRFSKISYGIGAIVAILHDVFVIVSIFVFLNKEFNLTTVAALLTVVGYSLNDTIVIFDRIRENREKYLDSDLTQAINISINECLSRTLLTSFTTILVVGSLYFFGGEIINNFAFAILIGLIVGTYSSIYIASQIVIIMTKYTASKKIV